MAHPPEAIDVVLFDLDGTLVDPTRATIETLTALLAEQLSENWAGRNKDRATVLSKEFWTTLEHSGPHLSAFRPSPSIGVTSLLDQFFAVRTPAEMDVLEQRFADLWCAGACRRARLYDGILGLLDGVEQEGLSWGIVTNRAEAMVEAVVRNLGLARAHCIVTASAGLAKKPSPDPLRRAARELGALPARCAYVGDTAGDVEAATRARMHPFVARWSAGPSPSDADPWLRRASGVFERPDQVMPTIRRLRDPVDRPD